MAENRSMVRRRGTQAARQAMPAELDLEAIQARGTQAFDRQRAAAPASGGDLDATATGALAGVGMGAVFGGPVGLAIGGLVGVLSHLSNERQAATMANWQDTLNEIDERTTEQLATAFEGAETQSDRDQLTARAANWRNTMEALQASGPDRGTQLLGTLASAGLLDGGTRQQLEGMQARQEKLDDDTLAQNRAALLSNRTYLRTQAQALFQEQRDVEQRMGQANELLSDPETNIDHPFVQAELMKQLAQAKRNMLSNAEDMTDAMRGVGGTGLLGGAAALASLFFGTEKAEEMRFSREQWRGLLRANEEFARRDHSRQREALYTEADAHVQLSEQFGLPADEFTALLGRFRGVEERADTPLTPERGAYPPGIEGGARPTTSGAAQALEGAGSTLRGVITGAQNRLDAASQREEERRKAREAAERAERERQQQNLEAFRGRGGR